MADEAAWQPLLERSIAAFAEGDLEGGRLACDRLLAMHDVPWNVAVAAGRNAVFYAAEIGDLLPGWRERRLEVPADPGWQSFNPSIAARPEGGATVLVRQGNFRLEPPTTYVTTDGDAAFRTRYRVLDLDDELEPVGPSRELRVAIPDDGRAWPEVPDIEDLRLFRAGERWLAAGSQSCRVPGRPRREVRFGLFELELDPADSRIVSVQWLANGLSGITEKNWMPVAGQQVPALVYESGPTTVVFVDPATGRPGLAALNGAPPLAERFRGGSQAIPVADGFLALVHEVAFWEDESRSYLHRLVRFDAEFHITHLSHPIRFFGENIEFAAGLALVGDRLAMSFGIDDAEAWIGDAPLAEAMDLLLPVAHLAPEGPREPEMPEGLAHVLGIVEPQNIELPDDWEGLQQRSIDAFYADRPEEGRLACDRLLNRLDAPDVSRLVARRNAVYYAPDLRDVVPGYREVELDFEMPPGWFALNPTVAADPSGGLAVMVRGSNWSAAHGGPHPDSGEPGARSVYVALRIDDALQVTADLGALEDRGPAADDLYLPIQGNEDYRLFRLGDRWLASASAWRLRPDGQPAIRLGLWDVDLDAEPAFVDDPRWLADGGSGVQEKNWMPAVAGEDLYFVHSCGPTAVVRCDPATGALTLAAHHPAPPMATRFRGGSQLLADGDGWLALVHDIAVSPEERRTYLHRLVRFGPDFAITHVSHPFRFHGKEIEFAAGLARAGDRLVISFGVGDAAAWVASVPADGLAALLLPVEDLAPGGPVETPLPDGLAFALAQWADRAAAGRRVKDPPAEPSLAGLRRIPPREDGLPTIAAVTLSGNSRDVIGDAIRSAIDWVDAVIVIDTGITGDTLEVARAAAGDRLMVAEFPWIDDFAAARNFALAAAAVAGADWAVNLDTDERIDLRGDDVRAILAATVEDGVFVNHVTGHYKKERFFRMPLRGEYVGPTHECWIGGSRSTLPNAVFDELGKSEEQLKGKLERDAEILERHTAAHPGDPRWWYYLADTQANLGRQEEALASFGRCMAIGGWDEEAGWSAYRAARILGDEMKRWDEAEAMAARGLLHHPAMVDLHWVAGYSAFWGGHFQRAANWARTAIALNAQQGTGLIPERGGFKYPPAEREAPWDVLRHALRRLGDEAGADAAERRYQEIVNGSAAREPRDAPDEPDPAGSAVLSAAPPAGADIDLRAASLDTLVERSIEAFYAGRHDEGRLACDLILSHPEADAELRANTRRNAVHYAPVLRETVPGYASHALPVDLPDGWFAFNPSIARHDGRLVALVRCANYAMPGWVLAPGETAYRSRCVLFDLDDDGAPAGPPSELDDPTDRDPHRGVRTHGLEDLRLVSVDGRLLAAGSAMRESPPGREVVAFGLTDVDPAESRLADLRWLSDGTSGTDEKNWMPAATPDGLRFVYSCGPTAVLAADPVTGALSLAALHDAPAFAAGLRGGTQLVPREDGWLALVHESAEWSPVQRTYLHRAVRFDAEFRITHVSHPFRFEGENIEFAAGMVIDGDRALVSFGVGDREARLASLPLRCLSERLIPAGAFGAAMAPTTAGPGLRALLGDDGYDPMAMQQAPLPADARDLLAWIDRATQPRGCLQVGPGDGPVSELVRCPVVWIGSGLDRDRRIAAETGLRRLRVIDGERAGFLADGGRPDVLGGLPLDLAVMSCDLDAGQALREFAGVEARSHPGTVVVLTDARPAGPDGPAETEGAASRMAARLRNLRPDLTVDLLGPETGFPDAVAVVTGLAAGNAAGAGSRVRILDQAAHPDPVAARAGAAGWPNRALAAAMEHIASARMVGRGPRLSRCPAHSPAPDPAGGDRTLVSALLYLAQSRVDPARRVALLEPLFASGIPLVLFVDRFYRPEVRKLGIPDWVTLVEMELADLLTTQRIASMASPPRMPERRVPAENTVELMALIAAKTELVALAVANGLVEAPYTGFIDAGLAKVFGDPERAFARIRDARLDGLGQVLAPGIWPAPTDLRSLTDAINWRYCGGLFVTPTSRAQELATRIFLVLDEFLRAGRIAWEVNLWALAELRQPGLFRWYPADHDDRMAALPDPATW